MGEWVNRWIEKANAWTWIKSLSLIKAVKQWKTNSSTTDGGAQRGGLLNEEASRFLLPVSQFTPHPSLLVQVMGNRLGVMGNPLPLTHYASPSPKRVLSFGFWVTKNWQLITKNSSASRYSVLSPQTSVPASPHPSSRNTWYLTLRTT